MLEVIMTTLTNQLSRHCERNAVECGNLASVTSIVYQFVISNEMKWSVAI